MQSTDCKSARPQFLLLAKKQPVTQQESADGKARIGFIIAKKKVRLAVERNRIKRQVRELFRQQRDALPALDIVFMARQDLDHMSNEQIRHDVTRALARLSSPQKS